MQCEELNTLYTHTWAIEGASTSILVTDLYVKLCETVPVKDRVVALIVLLEPDTDVRSDPGLSFRRS